MDVGIRELKANLSAYVARAAAGETIVVTDRGHPTAVLAPVPGSTVDRGIEEGWITPASHRLRPARRHRAELTAAAMIDDDRGTD